MCFKGVFSCSRCKGGMALQLLALRLVCLYACLLVLEQTRRERREGRLSLRPKVFWGHVF